MKNAENIAKQHLKNLRIGAGLKGYSSISTIEPDTLNYPENYQSKILPPSVDVIDAISGVFTLLESSYPGPFRHLFPDDESLIAAKKTWVSILNKFQPKQIIDATKHVIKHSKYFPTVGELYRRCQKLSFDALNLKIPLEAYLEACTAVTSENHKWSHEAVRLAAKRTGWHNIKSSIQKIVFPVFEEFYQMLCHQVIEGKPLITPLTLEDQVQQHRLLDLEAQANKKQRQLMHNQSIHPDDSKQARQRIKDLLN